MMTYDLDQIQLVAPTHGIRHFQIRPKRKLISSKSQRAYERLYSESESCVYQNTFASPVRFRGLKHYVDCGNSENAMDFNFHHK